ncbi:hypothetical protein E2H86_15850 [Pseudomonas putida]|uniref:hypothetical protein n=1 Tax=Pseudomonas TaxID=286 RepID=UPI001059915E|nr:MULTISPECIES: hypothetical protein [Pseudomonas]MBF8745364.1 hypothetical protein [Pseudomonas monteilii]MCT8166446.1 hypothetical protein [Pseudomonas sp. HD6422]MCT8185291.1 hypothetical protein [Pseudomonas sp. HD6421]TDJ75966.1 hypothetical protein E2H86_15850 [Pseudomonas putida]
MSVTLKCLECDAADIVKPDRPHKKSIVTCRACGAIAVYADVLEATGQRLMAELQRKLASLSGT